LVSHVKGRRQIEGVREQGADHNIWTYDEVTEEWRKLHNVELMNLDCPPHVV
jgi:hypothetical protein